MVSFYQALILSIIQGITEWFPVSSSGHLALVQRYFGLKNVLAFDVFLHFASLFAIIFVFRKEIFKIMRFRLENLEYVFLIVVSIIPAFLFGFLMKDFIQSTFYNLVFLGIFFIFSGLMIFSTKFCKERKSKMGLVDAFFIGLMQALALFPGISRSGMTISGGIFRGIKKEEAVRFSFLLSIPVILGASLAEATHVFELGISYRTLAISFVVTFLVSLAAINLLFRIVKSDNFYLFGVYNFVLGILVLFSNLF